MAMERKTKWKIGGITLFAFGTFVAKETVSWLIGAAITWATKGLNFEAVQAWPWQQIVGLLGMAMGLGFAFWPDRKRSTPENASVNALGNGQSSQGEQGTTPFRRVGLSEVEAEKLGAAFQEIHDFLTRDVRRFEEQLRRLARQPNELGVLFEQLQEVRQDQDTLLKKAIALAEDHRYSIELVSLDLRDVTEAISQLSAPLANFRKAQDWPLDAQREKARSVVNAVGELHTKSDWLRAEIQTLRKRYLGV